MTVVTTGATVLVTGVSVLATVVTTGATALVTGARVLAVVVTTGAATGVTGARVLAVVLTTGAATGVTGARVLAAAVTTGAATGVTGAGTPEDDEPVTGATVELTAEPTAEAIGAATEPTPAAVEPAVVCVDVRGGSAAVAVCAGRENSSMITKIPAPASAACSALRAMRRTIGCGMSSSHSTRNRAARLPRAAASNLAHTNLLFGDHRTAASSIGQG